MILSPVKIFSIKELPKNESSSNSYFFVMEKLEILKELGHSLRAAYMKQMGFAIAVYSGKN